MRWLDLFSGIGGFSLGLERAGHRTVAFCEIDPFCRKVLAKHWPGVPCYDDIRTLTAGRLAADGIIECMDDAAGARLEGATGSLIQGHVNGFARAGIDGICGGFPCQDISTAGKGAGIDGARSGLWSEYARLVGELRPQYVFVENVAALLGRGLGRVLGDLAALGYDAEWHCIPASAVGAPHRRDRVWIIAHAADQGSPRAGGEPQSEGAFEQLGDGGTEEDVADPGSGRCGGAGGGEVEQPGRAEAVGAGDGGDTYLAGLAQRQSIRSHHVEELAATVGADWWQSEPDVGRVAHGVPARVDRLRSLGNAVVPQVVEMIARTIPLNAS